MTAPRGAASWLLRHLPETIAVNPERVLINVGVILIGLSVLLGERSPVLNRLWPFPLYEWGAIMVGGGVTVLVGIARRKRTLERLGMILVAAGCLLYAVLLMVVIGWPGVFTAIIFLAIAAAKIIRLVVTSAVRSSNIRIGEQMEEMPPDGER